MLFPIKDNNPTRKTAYITILLISINCLIFLYQFFISGVTPEYYIKRYALIPYEISNLTTLEIPLGHSISNEFGIEEKNLIYRDVSIPASFLFSMFMHGSLAHLFGNMLFLWIFGNNIEDYLGKTKFILFYLLCGIGSSLAHIIFNLNSQVPIIGASGAVSGVMGAYLLLYPRAMIRSLVFVLFFITFIDIPAYVFLLVWFVFQFFYAGGSNIAWLAHIGGFIIGYLLILWQRKKNKPLMEIIDDNDDFQ